MRSLVALVIFILGTNRLLDEPYSGWQLAGNKIVTPWADSVHPAHPLPEYPRPQMLRDG